MMERQDRIFSVGSKLRGGWRDPQNFIHIVGLFLSMNPVALSCSLINYILILNSYFLNPIGRVSLILHIETTLGTEITELMDLYCFECILAFR